MPFLFLAAVLLAGSSPRAGGTAAAPVSGVEPWRGFHMRFGSHEDVPALKRLIAEHLAPMGVNVLVLEVNMNFQFKSHPELAGGTLTADDARELAALCRERGIRLIPLFECLGHQGWGGGPNILLEKYPEFDETPYIPRDAQWPEIYCRSWCPLHPGVNPIVFDLMDELIAAFQADAFHVGMDEVFAIADARCPRCAGRKPAEIFAKAVNDYYDHLVREKGVAMLMWGDRLIDARGFGYSRWEADFTGTWPAMEMIPRDIVICDWHYTARSAYPSVYLFLNAGFRVWPATWNSPRAARALMSFARQAAARKNAADRVLGMLVTGWNATSGNMLAALTGGDLGDDPGDIRGIAETIEAVMDEF